MVIKRIIVGVAVLGLSAQTWAHDPPDLVIPAAHFPVGNEPVIDGLPGEWDPIPVETYGSVGELLYPVGGATAEGEPLEFAGQGDINPSDFQIRHKLGWSKSENKFYWLTEVFDDLHFIGRLDPNRFWIDDSIEYGVNFKHQAGQGGTYGDGDVLTEYRYKYTYPALEGQYEFLEPHGNLPWMKDGTKWITFGATFTGEEFGESTYFYEIGITPIEEMPNSADATEDQVIEGILEEGMIIHWGNMISDTDEGGTADQKRETQWSTAPSGAAGNSVQDVLMAPLDPNISFVQRASSVEAASWAQIKAQYR
jgi:hypothetical protein